jgi:hypothetical protein
MVPMAETSRANKTLLGCGLGCGGALVLLIGGCFAFQAWLESPGELLAPTAMLDPRATTHVALRLDLADPPTRQLVDQMLAAARRPSDRLRREAPPTVEYLVRWNEERQQRDLTRLFPITAAWVVWPGEHEAEGVGAVVVSARGMSHQVVFMDWVLGLLAGRVKNLPARLIAGERVYELPIGRGEVIYAFLDPAGVIVCLDLASVAPAAERLAQHRATSRATRAPTELERRLAGVPADLPLRGAVVDHRGEIAQLLAWLAPEADRSHWEPSWEPIEAATVAGRFTGGAGVALTLELAVDPAASGPRRELLLADLQRYFAAHPAAGKATVRSSVEGVTLDLLVDELPRRFEEMERAGAPSTAGSVADDSASDGGTAARDNP